MLKNYSLLTLIISLVSHYTYAGTSKLNLIIDKSVVLENGISDYFQVEIPKSEKNYYPISIAISFQGNPAHYYYVEEIVGPQGIVTGPNMPTGNLSNFALDYLSGYPISQAQSPNPAGPGDQPGFGSFLLPSNPMVELHPGLWKFKIRGGQYEFNSIGKRIFKSLRSTISIKGLLKSSEVPFNEIKSGKLVLNFFMPNDLVWNFQAINNDAVIKKNFNDFLDSVRKVYFNGDGTRKINIELGELRPLNSENNLTVLASGFLSQKYFSKTGINIFLVNVKGNIVGQSVGIPGTFFNDMYGNAVTIQELRDGRILAHELAHFLGLWHTEGLFPDMITDTEPNAPNLMQATSPQDQLTKMQMDVLLFNPWVELFQ